LPAAFITDDSVRVGERSKSFSAWTKKMGARAFRTARVIDACSSGEAAQPCAPPEASTPAQYEARSTPSTVSMPPNELPAAAILSGRTKLALRSHASAAS